MVKQRKAPPDVVEGAKETAVAWFLLLVFAIVLGYVIRILGVNKAD